MKTPKLNFFFDLMRGEFKSKWALVEGKTTSRKKMPFFDQLAVIFATDMYTFLESACQGAADEPIKTQKNLTFFFDL